MAPGRRDGRDPRVHAKAAQDLANVVAHRVDRQLESGRNLLAREAVGEQDENFVLPRRELDTRRQGSSSTTLTLEMTPKTPSTFPVCASGTELIGATMRQPSVRMRFRSKFVTRIPSSLLVKISRARAWCSGATMTAPY